MKNFFDIPDDIFSYAAQKGNLQAICSGGGLDYVAWLNDSCEIIVSNLDFNGSPDSLESECLIIMFKDTDSWERRVEFKMKTTKQAIDAIHCQAFKAALAIHSAGFLAEAEAESWLDTCLERNPLTSYQLGVYDEGWYSYIEIAESTMKAWGVSSARSRSNG